MHAPFLITTLVVAWWLQDVGRGCSTWVASRWLQDEGHISEIAPVAGCWSRLQYIGRDCSTTLATDRWLQDGGRTTDVGVDCLRNVVRFLPH
ncbi:hypothetical protein SESBI_47293 [Sesbania bispinosa]|nr:hypothetical protein SESBI_47293 [Sesbania bispinosa]